jgi:hypothetical protein
LLKEHILQLSSLSDRWRNLEERIKEAEQISGTVIIPAINELRYSGRRFFEAWLIAAQESVDHAGEREFRKHIIMAEQYFNNADHDLTDALIMFFSERQDQILTKYGLLRSTEMYPRIVQWMHDIKSAQDLIRSSRGNRHNRMEEYHKLSSNNVPSLARQYNEILSPKSYIRPD